MTLEDIFKSWGAAPGTTEQQKMENAEGAVRKAINADAMLSAMDISIIPQGSYRSKTNVRQDSDVDIAVCLNPTFFYDLSPSKSKEHYKIGDGHISYVEFRRLVTSALSEYFSFENITPGNKAIDIHSNTYRVDADVVPVLAYRYYHGEDVEDYIQPTGVGFDTSDGKRIINWPQQTYDNGLAKHNRTSQRFRKMVRIVKKLRNQMQEKNITEADDIGSFLIESMVWNAPDNSFGRDTYSDDVRAVLAYCFNESLPSGSHATLREVNDIKLLFGAHQPWTRERAHAFFSKAWDYVGFE